MNNYRELHDELHDHGYEFPWDTDTTVIRRAYQEYDDACVERLRGMFAFAIYR